MGYTKETGVSISSQSVSRLACARTFDSQHCSEIVWYVAPRVAATDYSLQVHAEYLHGGHLTAAFAESLQIYGAVTASFLSMPGRIPMQQQGKLPCTSLFEDERMEIKQSECVPDYGGIC